MATRTIIGLIIAFILLAGAAFFLSKQNREEPENVFTPSALDLDTTTSTTNTSTNTGEVATDPVNENPSIAQKACVTGGCNGELCVEAGAQVSSTCEARIEYSCLKQYAVCERQTTGACGWTTGNTYNECMIEISEK